MKWTRLFELSRSDRSASGYLFQKSASDVRCSVIELAGVPLGSSTLVFTDFASNHLSEPSVCQADDEPFRQLRNAETPKGKLLPRRSHAVSELSTR